MFMKRTNKRNIKYDIARNNYVGLLFFACVLAALLYIIKTQTPAFQELTPTQKEILTPETEILKPNDEINKLMNYLNPGDINTFKIYQSSYIYNESVSSNNLNEETMLYYAYKYIERTTDFSKYQTIITCNQAESVNLQSNIYQCGGTKVTNSYYMVNSYITKERLKKAVLEIFNKNITNFTNFYTTEDNLCYFVNNEYLCVSHKTQRNVSSDKQFVKAYKYSNKITIIEKYKYIEDGIYYKGFNSNEVGEEYYISTFNKVNGKYYWSNTEVYKEN